MKRVKRLNSWTVRRASGPSLALLFLLGIAAASIFLAQERSGRELTFSQLIFQHEVPPPFRRVFDGQPMSEATAARFSVIIDNMREGRPPAGVRNAGLVIEAPVEAGITRWLAFYEFDCQLSVVSCQLSKIGPVRSLRPYFLSLAEGYQTPIAHVGGSPEALRLARRSTLPTLNEFGHGGHFFRDMKRADPHRIFTRPALLLQAIANFRIELSTLEMPWQWKGKKLKVARKKDEFIAFSFTGYPPPPEAALSWRYDPAAAVFVRAHGDAPQRDAEGELISATNVFVVETAVVVTDAIGRRRITTTGRGTAWQLTPNGKQRLTWQRAEGKPYSFTSADGVLLTLPPGRVWITLVPVGQEIVESF